MSTITAEMQESTNTVQEICAILGHYGAYSGNPTTDVSGQPIVPISKGRESRLTLDDGRFLTTEDWTDRMYRNVGNGIPISHKRADLIYFAMET